MFNPGGKVVCSGGDRGGGLEAGLLAQTRPELQAPGAGGPVWSSELGAGSAGAKSPGGLWMG